MANPNAAFDNIQWPGGDGLRVPQERAGFRPLATQTGPTLDTYGEVDLGSVSGTVKLTIQQAGASLITLTPSAAVTLVFPNCQPGYSTIVQNLSATYAITAEVNGNTTNTATCAVSVMTTVVFTGLNGGCRAQASA